MAINNIINQINDIDGLEINNLLTNFNEYESKNNEIRLIEQDKKNKLNLNPNQFNKYKDTLESLESEFNTNLIEIKWIYIAYLKNPDSIDYSRDYYRIKARLDSILDQINITSIEIQKSTNYLNDISKKINNDLDYYKNENEEIIKKYNNIKSVNDTSKAIKDDYTDLYKKQRSYNIGMVITFIIAFFLMRKIFTQSTSSTSSTSSTLSSSTSSTLSSSSIKSTSSTK
jgi:hypothetical protein